MEIQWNPTAGAVAQELVTMGLMIGPLVLAVLQSRNAVIEFVTSEPHADP